MDKRKILAVKASVLAVAAVFGAPSPAVAADGDTSVQLYGHLDLSIDDATKGLNSGRMSGGGAPLTGRMGWQSDISSNLSYFGLRGSHDIGGGNRMVFQIETQVDVAATPGLSPITNSTTDTKVPAALGSRNSFLGIAGNFGALKIGKTDAPYKLSTARMDPFSATVGDYNSVIGNTGGDNRAEFDTRLSHAIWYESNKMGAFSWSALFAPGQNRAGDNSINASGEPDCTGGNSDFSGQNCTDGSFGDAFSVAGVYEAGPLYAILAFEAHKKVNRTGDEVSGGGDAPDGSVGVVDERAMKAGVQYLVSRNTTINVIFERLTRKAPLSDFNERQHNASWLALTQKLTAQDDLNLGWAHAGKTPGDPAAFSRADNSVGPGPVDNATNMYTVGYKHHFDKQSNWYAVYARQANHNGAHYDLGASGHGITTDCHDAAGHCFEGGILQAVSVGWMYSF